MQLVTLWVVLRLYRWYCCPRPSNDSTSHCANHHAKPSPCNEGDDYTDPCWQRLQLNDEESCRAGQKYGIAGYAQHRLDVAPVTEALPDASQPLLKRSWGRRITTLTVRCSEASSGVWSVAFWSHSASPRPDGLPGGWWPRRRFSFVRRMSTLGPRAYAA